MRISDLSGKNICILGFGREGRAMAEAIETNCEGFEITVADQNDTIDVPEKYWKQVGTGWLENLDKFDVIIKSPGIPPHELPTSLQYSSSTEIFLETVRNSGATVVGVTGSKGKSTTASLIHHILADRRSQIADRSILVGNIGRPAISHLSEAKNGTIFVLEMSSYQLLDITSSPKIAVVTSFFPEHLDYHRSLKSYLNAKRNITKFQTETDSVFFNTESSESEEIAEGGEGKKIPVKKDNAPLELTETKLIGEHNRMNIALAWKVCESLGVQKEQAVEAIKTFSPLPHRLESLGEHHGMEWVNDSISTTPESCIVALDALGENVSTLILGGQDRGQDFSELAKKIKESKLKTVITLGEVGPEIANLLRDLQCMQLIIDVKDLEAAVTEAKRQKSDGIVLLSPAAPSYDQFKNFEERGQKFKKLIDG